MPKFRNIPSSSSKKNLHAPLFEEQTLLTTNQIIDHAIKTGVDFGPGDPAERIRYFIKLGILPHAVKKRPGNLSTVNGQLSTVPIGHLPYSCVKKLIDVDRLYKKGLSYPQIAQKLTSEEKIKTEQEEARQSPQKAKPIEDPKPRIIYVQKIGNKDIKDTLKQHELKLEKLVRDEFAHSLSLGKTEPDVQETSTLKDQLIPTQEIISKAKTAGVSFGNGDPYERIRHLIKLGILPHATRKTVKDPIAGLEKTVGHLPEWSVKRLIYVNKMHQNGLTFEQIAERIQKLEQAKFVRAKAKQATSSPSLISEPSKGDKPSINFFPKIGVSENYIDKKLEEYQANFHKILDYKLAQTPLSLGSTPIDFEPKSKFWPYFKGLAITGSLTILVSIGIISGRNYLSPDQNKQLQENQNISSNLVGEVLAATSDTHRLYIDADTQVSGTTLFAENITAPNVLYGAVAGTGITVSGGQTPTIGLDTTGVVVSLNDLAGALTISGSGGTSISASGSTIKISSSSGVTSEADTLATVTGRGATTSTALTFSGGLTLGGNLSLSDTNSIFNLTNAGSLAFKDGTNTLLSLVDQGSYATLRLSNKGSTGDASTCTAGDIYFNATDATVKACTATNTWEALDGGGSMSSFTLSGDSGTDQTISDTNTFEIAGGTNGIDTVAGATDTVTLNFDSTEVGTTTWGSGSSIAWTFNAGATDPVLTFDSNALTIASAATITATDVTSFNCTDCLDFDDFDDTLDIDATTTINTTATTTTPLSYLADSLTTGTGLIVSADALTTGTALDVSSTSTAGGASGTSYVLNLARSGANSNTAHTAYGLASSVTNTNATSGTNIAGYFTATGATTANYALYIPNQTDATGPNYGLYVAGADDYSIYSAAGDIYFGMGTSTTDQLRLVSTTSTATTAGVFDLDITSNTNNNRAIDLAYTFGGGLSSRGYGIYGTYTTSGNATGRLNYGIFNQLTDASASNLSNNFGVYSNLTISNTGTQISDYAGYFNANSTGAISTDYKNVYGIYAKANADSTASGGTSNAYGGYFVGDGDTDGTGTAYGVYTTASGGDTNYGIFSTGADTANVFTATSSTTTTGVIDLNVTTETSNNRAFDLNYTYNNTDLSENAGYGIYGSISHTASGVNGVNKLYGAYISISDPGPNGDDFGVASILSLTGAPSTTGTRRGYGFYSSVYSNYTGSTHAEVDQNYGIYAASSNARTNDIGTVNNYGGYFSATGTTQGTTAAYGIYATASGADTNYAGVFSGDVDISGHSAFGNNASVSTSYILNVDETFTGSGAFDAALLIPRYTGTDTSIILAGAEIGGSWQGDTGSSATRVTGLRLLPIQNSSTAITNLYGLNTFISNDSSAGSGTISNAYGAYFSTGFGGVVSLTNSYGIRINSFGVSGATATYGLYIDPQTGSTNNYGLCFDCDGTWTSSTVASGIQFGTDSGGVNLYRGSNNTLKVDGNLQLANSSATVTTGTLEIDVTSLTHQNNGINLAYTSTAAGADTTVTQYGIYNSFASTQAVTATSPAFTYYGQYNSTTKSGADNLTTGGTFNTYGIYQNTQNTSTDAGAAGTRNTYGAYINTTGAAGGTTKAYGIYGNVTGADTNISAYLTATNAGTTGTFTSNTIGGVSNIDSSSSANYTGVAGQLVILNGSSDSSGTNIGLLGSISRSVNLGNITGWTRSIQGQLTSLTSTGTVTNHATFYATNPTLGSGAITNNYALYIEDQTAATNDYGIYVAGADSYSIYTAADDVAFVFAAADQLTIDAEATDNTGSAGVIDLDVDTTSSQSGIDIDIETITDSGVDTVSGIKITATQTSTDDDVIYGVHVANLAGTADSGNEYAIYQAGTSWDYGLYVEDSGYFNTSLDVEGQFSVGTQDTFTDLDATPNVSAASHFITNTSAVTITDFDAGAGTLENGQIIYVESNGAITYDVTSSGLIGGTTDIVTAAGDLATWLYDGTDWILVSFMDISDNHNAGSGFDLAEWFATTEELTAGELVSVDSTISQNIIKSPVENDSKLIGVVSTQPGLIIGKPAQGFSNLIALAGRVPTKVNSENGPIQAGDYITSSSTPGVGMRATKAGRVIGMALGSFDCAQDSSEIIDHSLELDNSQDSTNSEPPTQHSICQGQIVVFVNPTFYLGTNLASNGSLNSQSSTSEVENSYTSEVLLADNQIDQSGVLVGNQNYEGQILTAAQIRRLVVDEVTKQLASSPIPDRDSSLVNEASDSAKPSEATDSAGLAQQTQQTLDELNSLLSTADLKLDTLAVTGNSNLAQTQVAGTFSQDGTLIIDYGKQINVLGSTLYLQNDPLAGCSTFSDPVSKNSNETGSSCANGILVNIGAGKLTIDNQGNLVTSGKLIADSVQTKKLIVYTDEGSAKTVGTSSISSGSSSQTILTTALEPNAKILITPRTPTGGKIIYISESVDFEGFTVSLENGPATGEIKFDWLIVNTKELSQATN